MIGRRSFLRLLGLAPVAVPAVIAEASKAVPTMLYGNPEVAPTVLNGFVVIDPDGYGLHLTGAQRGMLSENQNAYWGT